MEIIRSDGALRHLFDSVVSFQIASGLPQPAHLTIIKNLSLPGSLMRSRVMSLVEAAANVLMGYGVAVVTQMIVFP